jgi:hypothetical protein
MKTTNSGYGNKVFPKIKVFFFHTPLRSMFSNDTMVLISFSSPKIFFNKNSPMFYSNSNGDKNYVI